MNVNEKINSITHNDKEINPIKEAIAIAVKYSFFWGYYGYCYQMK